MEMNYRIKDRDLTISLNGELDHHAVRGAMESVERWIEQHMPGKTILDLAGLTFMDSSGIAFVIRTKRRAELMGSSLAVVNIPRQAARVLETAGLAQFVELKVGDET